MAQVYFFDGACRGKVKDVNLGKVPPYPKLACGGDVYVFSPDAGGPSGPSAVGLTVYVVYGGKNDAKAPVIQGETDVFKAWGDLHHSLNRGVGRQVGRIDNARRRIRRAVR